jgi:iron complex transport system substrate-binding protein
MTGRRAGSRSMTLLALAALVVAAIAGGGCSQRLAANGANVSGAATGTAGAAVETAAVFPVTVTDDAKRSVTVKARPERIVSLAPANTEILAALGLMNEVVGVTTYDDYPAEVKDIAKVGDFVKPNFEAVAAAKPDLVLVTTGVQAATISKLEALGATVIAIDPQTLAGVYRGIETVGAATGATGQADEVVGEMQYQVEEIAARIGSATPVPCFIEIGWNPLFTAGRGTLMDDLMTAAGGANVVTGKGYVGYSAEQLVKDDPAVYLATSSSLPDPGQVAKRPGYAKLRAVKSGRVVVLEDDLVSRPGPRIVDGLEQMARALHPEAFK